MFYGVLSINNFAKNSQTKKVSLTVFYTPTDQLVNVRLSFVITFVSSILLTFPLLKSSFPKSITNASLEYD